MQELYSELHSTRSLAVANQQTATNATGSALVPENDLGTQLVDMCRVRLDLVVASLQDAKIHMLNPNNTVASGLSL